MSIKQLPSGIEVRIRQDLSEGSRGDTTLIIDPIITKSGHRVTMDDIGVRGFGKIDANNPREEIISWTGIIDNGTTYTLTGVVWGINFHNSTGNFTDNMKRHISGAKFSINTDMHYIADNYVNKRDFNVNDNSIGWGDGTKDENKVLEARNGTANQPFIVYNETVNKWLISNDGINTYDILAGDSGLEAGVATLINAGKIDVQVGDASGVQVVDNKINIVYQNNPGLEVNTSNELGVKIKEDTGLIKDADGLWCDSIDPGNPTPLSPAKLIGGTDVVLQNFIDLADGANDGAFKINIDGVEYDNVSIDLSSTGISISQEIGEETGVNYSRTYSDDLQGQSFFWEGGTLTKIDLTLRKVNTPTGEYTLNLYEADENDFPTGSVIKSVSKLSQDLTTSYADYSFDFNVLLVGNKKYVLVLSYTGGSTSHYVQWAYTDSNVYSGGISIRSFNGGSSWSTNGTSDKRFIIYGINSEEEMANVIQTAIRTKTSKGETVIWDTDHFEITSTISGKNKGSQVLKLQPPTTGTDISGAGYLDLGENAIEVAGDGDDYKLVRLDEDGKIPLEVLGKLSSQIGENHVTSGRALNTVYQNTTNRTKIVSVSTRNSGYSGGGKYSESFAYIGTTNPPSTLVGRYSTLQSGIGQLFMIVPPNYYYTITATYEGTDYYDDHVPKLVSWFECDLI